LDLFAKNERVIKLFKVPIKNWVSTRIACGHNMRQFWENDDKIVYLKNNSGNLPLRNKYTEMVD